VTTDETKPVTPAEMTGPIRILFPYLDGQKGRLAALAFFSLIGGFAEASVLVIVARLAFAFASKVDSVQVDLGPFGQLTAGIPTVLGVAVGMVAVRAAMQLISARISAVTFSDVRKNLRATLMREYLSASWALQSEERAGKLQELATTFVAGVAQSVFTLTQLVVSTSSLAIFVITAFAVNAAAAVAVAVASIGLALALRPIRHVVRRRSLEAQAANLVYATNVSEVAVTMQEVRVFDVEQPVLDHIGESIDETARLDRRARFVGSIGPSIYQSVALLLIVGALAVVYAADLSRLASFGGILLILIRSLAYGQASQAAVQSLQASAPTVEILDEERARLVASAAPRDGKSLASIGVIGFDAVSFEYLPGRPVLRNLSFTVPHGEIVGIVGPSGAGKSTLVQLLLGLRHPTVGQIIVDGQNAAEFAQSDWFTLVSFVPQDARLFSGTVAENIAFYRDNVDHAAIERAARQANFHHEVLAMTDGYDQWVGEGGVRLSGGQRQRLCIARALAEDPDVLVLDEPTSSLDVKSESLIRESLAALSPRTTVFIIAHRLSTLDICDRIMVIHEGMLQGFDTPGRLEENDPFYREALTLSGLR
jgi:ABC-type multidrug transport system fused ATPase/permease subunit